MKKNNTIVLCLLLFIALLLGPRSIYAQNIAGESASFVLAKGVSNTEAVDYGLKKMAIKNVLERYNSPLLPYVDDFVNACRKYEMDCYLIPAISGLESTFGQFIYPQSYNAWGFGGGYIMFGSWENGIDQVASTLRHNYIDKGATTVETIAPIYAESKTWAPRVNWFKKQFEAEEQKLQLYFGDQGVQL